MRAVAVMTEPTDELLVPALARGDEGAIATLLERYWARAYRVAHQLTGDPGAAEDVAQETFVKVLRAAGQFDASRAFRPWFFQVLRNEARQQHRSRARRAGHEERAAAADRAPETRVEAADAVRTYLARLPEEHREPIALHYLEGLTFDQVAEVLGCPRGTVASRIKRGLDSLRSRLEPSHALSSAALVEVLERALRVEAPPAPSPIEIAAGLTGTAPDAVPGAPLAGALAVAARGGRRTWAAAAATVTLLALAGLATLVLDEEREPERQALNAAPPDAPGPAPAPTPTPAPTPAPTLAPPSTPDGAPVDSGDEAQADAPAPAAPWAWLPPSTVLEGTARLHPLGMVTVEGAQYLALMKIGRGPRDPISLQLWTRRDARWEAVGEPIAPPESELFSHVFVLGRDIGLLSHGNYVGGVHFLRVDTRGQVLRRERLLTIEELEAERLAVSSVAVERDRLLTVSVLVDRAQTGKNALLVLRSHDSGASWSRPAQLETTMHEDHCRMRGFQWSETSLGRFVVEGAGREVRFLRSDDGALSWSSERVALSDELGAEGRRLTLDGVQVGETAGVVYLATPEKQRGRGKYYFARSDDRGRTWGAGVPITEELKIDDPSTHVQVASANDLIVFAFVEVTGRWSDGEMRQRLTISEDGGATWARFDPETTLEPGSTLLHATEGGRSILLTGARKVAGEGEPRMALFVTELRR